MSSADASLIAQGEPSDADYIRVWATGQTVNEGRLMAALWNCRERITVAISPPGAARTTEAERLATFEAAVTVFGSECAAEAMERYSIIGHNAARKTVMDLYREALVASPGTGVSEDAKYAEEYGDESWELDALEPRLLSGLVRSEVVKVLDISAWEVAREEEEGARRELTAISEEYDNITERLDTTNAQIDTDDEPDYDR